MFTSKSTTFLLAAAAAAAGVSAAPTATTGNKPSGTVALTGVTHSVVAGLGGLRFDPANVVAEAGDVVQFAFLPANHSVAQSSFGAPCAPLAGDAGFFSGFRFATQDGRLAPDVFQIIVEDASAPIWYYCAQTAGQHCTNGMSGVINQDFDGPNTLAAYQQAAKGVDTVVPPVVQGGKTLPNPNPNGGF